MNPFIQIALGLAPVLLVFILLSVFGKKARPLYIVMAVVMVAAVGASVAGYFMYEPDLSGENVMSEKESGIQMDMIYALADTEGGSQMATAMLTDLQRKSVESQAAVLCQTYICGADMDWRGASALAAKVEQMGGKLPGDFKAALSKASAGDVETLEDLQKAAQKEISRAAKELDRNIRKAAEAMVSAQAIFSESLTGYYLDMAMVDDLLDTLDNAAEEIPELCQISQVRICSDRLAVLAGDYDKIVDGLEPDACYAELAIASELYINDLVDSKDFYQNHLDTYRNERKVVLKQLQSLLRHLPEEKTEDRSKVEALIAQLDKLINASGGDVLLEYMENVAKDKKNPDSPKASLQLAKIAYFLEDINRAKEHIREALTSLGVSDDEDFYVPMSQIAYMISEKDDLDASRNIATSVDAVINHSADEIVVNAVEKVEQGEGNKTLNEEFKEFTESSTVQMQISINIGKVDASKFSTVSAVLSMDESVTLSAEELQEMITVTDCGMPITDFTVEKVEYKAANILLCCDNSGSMGGEKIQSLRNAVTKFLETSSEKENIAIVTFDDHIVEEYGFGTDMDILLQAAEDMRDAGGTNMYAAVIDSMDHFTYQVDERNYILLLSDGADGYQRNTEDIQQNIGVPCAEKGIVMYCLGLGQDADLNYLTLLAQATGGDALVVNDAGTLDSFYGTLRSQIMNQYIITFEAKDTLTVYRNLSIHLTEDPIIQDTADYTLEDYTGDNFQQTEDGETVLRVGERGVYGLDVSRIMKSDKPTQISVRGFGFQEDDVLMAHLDGKLDYKSGQVECEYVDANTLKLIVPGGIASGSYDVHISVSGEKAIFKDGLYVAVPGSEKRTAFGPYVFTSDSKSETGGEILLSGNVTLNGWLIFQGDVTLEASYYDSQIKVTDNSGSYVRYYEESAEGLANLMAKKGMKLPIGAMGTFTLYDDPTVEITSSEYPVDSVPVPVLYFTDLVTMNMPGLKLYPNRIEISAKEFNSKFPMQDKLLKGSGLTDLFNFKANIDGIISNTAIDIRGSFGNKAGSGDDYRPVNFGNAPIYLAKSQFTVKFDTLKNEYEIDFGTKVAFINCDGLGLRVAWKARDTDTGLQRLMPSELEIRCDKPIKTTISGVPVTYSDFKLGVEDMDLNTSVLNWTLKGSFDLGTSKVSDYISGLKDYIDDPALLKLNDTTITLSLGQLYFAVETKLELIELIELGHAKIEAGKVPISCTLLDMENEDAYGMRAEVGRGIKMETNNCDINVGGSLAFHLHNKFIGVEAEGHVDATVKWFIFKMGPVRAQGQGVIGVTFANNQPSFVIKVLDNDNNVYYLLWNNDSNLKMGKTKL